MIKFLAGLTACFVVLCAGYAIASRNSSGTYSIPNTFTSGSVISSSAVNANFSDIGTELTSSLDRAGRGAMTAQLQLASGTVATPGLGFSSDTGSGLYRVGLNDIGFAISGTKVGEWTANGLRVSNGAVATPSLSFFNDTSSGLYRIGSNDIGFAINGALIMDWTASGASVGAMLSAANNPSFTIRASGAQSALYMEDGRGSAGNKVGRIIYDSGNNLSKAGWQFQNVGDTGAFVSGGFTVFRDGSISIATGIAANGSGFKHQSVAGCATAASIGALCTSTLTWTSAFSDSGYQAVCSCNAVTSGLPIIRSYTNSGDGVSIGISTMALTAAAAQCSVIVCMAAKD